MATNHLTDTFIKNLKFTGQKKYHDGGGLYVDLRPNNSKHFRMRYFFNSKEKLLSFGEYPIISLAEAREMRDNAKKLIVQGIDPGEQKKLEKNKKSLTFEFIALEWLKQSEANWSVKTREKYWGYLKNDILPYLGDLPIQEITAPQVLDVIRRVEARGVVFTPPRVLNCIGQIMRYAMVTGRANQDVTIALYNAINSPRGKHYATITEPKKVGQLLRDIDVYEGYFVVKCALKLAPLVFVRPGELRGAEWEEFDFEAKEWRIPENRMKMREEHIVPLSEQALEILNELKPYSGDGQYLFPSITSRNSVISDNTLNKALKIMGYGTIKDKMVAHGFRSQASTLLNGLGYNRDWIERQLAHKERNKIRAAYNFAEFLPERRIMMQEWADYLTNLKAN